jgi:D-psicose/D-tagatose/L-ribulose 3-epimerase
MRTSMNLLLWNTSITAEHYPILGKLKAAGFDGVEVPIFDGDETRYKDLRKELDKQGLACTAVTVVAPEANPISPEASIRKAALERLKWVLDMGAILGIEILCGPYHSPLGVFTGAGPTDDEKNRGADVLRAAAEEGQKRHIKLAIEYLNRFECYFLTTAKDAKDLVKRVNHPNFHTMWDTFHANIEERNIEQTIADFAGGFLHVHISENDRGTPGAGHVHWAETFRALRKAKYDGWLTIEAFGRALPALAAATKVWRDLFAKPEDVYLNGLAFMKQMWAKNA